jgi:peptidoglycan/LPS O-acetylase OafA/YrhL
MLKNRYLLLDGLRGIAALGIMSKHLLLGNWPPSQGLNILVDFFFVLSGFVLGPSIVLTDTESRIYFIKKRIIRIYPILIPVVSVMYLMNEVYYFQVRLGTSSYPIYYYLGTFFLIHLFFAPIIPMNTPLWSLSSEMFVNFALLIFPKRIGIFKFYVFLGFVLEVAGIFLNRKYDLGWGVIQYLIAAGRALVGFNLGILLRQKQVNSESKCNSKDLIIPIVLIFLTYLFFLGHRPTIVFAAPVFCLFISVISKIDESSFSKSFEYICIFLGRVSYGIYVWHGIVGRFRIPQHLISNIGINLSGNNLEIIAFLGNIGITLLIAELSLRLFENPIRKMAIQNGFLVRGSKSV